MKFEAVFEMVMAEINNNEKVENFTFKMNRSDFYLTTWLDSNWLD